MPWGTYHKQLVGNDAWAPVAVPAFWMVSTPAPDEVGHATPEYPPGVAYPAKMQDAVPIPAAEVPGGHVVELSITVIVPVGTPAAVPTFMMKLYWKGCSDPSYGTVPLPVLAGTNGRLISVTSGKAGTLIPVIADLATLTDSVPVDRP